MLYQKGTLNMLSRHLSLAIAVALFGSFAMGAEPNSLWIKKPVAEALEQAKRENKPALLYWGAIWCPPCNQLKAQVFSHPEFATATSSFIRIYLDGDDAGAQNWAEKLDVSGYPTVLVLAPEKNGRVTTMKERLRIAEFVNFTEFRSL
ncbi:MAG: thioredoxin family protein, partial [Proteobacteria bacterium]|nr:thioredoxin family protein [Pseudomonadota bacterium]